LFDSISSYCISKQIRILQAISLKNVSPVYTYFIMPYNNLMVARRKCGIQSQKYINNQSHNNAEPKYLPFCAITNLTR
jgi:hypothetical protein